MEISGCITELLLQNDSVTIEGFGTLIAGYGSASVHPVQHMFQPPKKVLSFDASLKTGDKNLVNAISKMNDVSESESIQSLRHFVDEIERVLKEKGAYELPGIGKFYFDIEKQLKFSSHPEKNLLLSSYGLHEFISMAVVHPENIPSYSVAPPKPEKKKRRFIWFRF